MDWNYIAGALLAFLIGCVISGGLILVNQRITAHFHRDLPTIVPAHKEEDDPHGR